MSRNNRTHALTPAPAAAPGKGAAAAQALADDHGTRGVSKGHKVELSATPRGRVISIYLCIYVSIYLSIYLYI